MMPDPDFEQQTQRQRDQVHQDAQRRAREAQELQALEEDEREAALGRPGRSERLERGSAQSEPTDGLWSDGAPMHAPQARSQGAAATLRTLALYALLGLALVGGIWFFFLRGQPQRLPGMDGAIPAAIPALTDKASALAERLRMGDTSRDKGVLPGESAGSSPAPASVAPTERTAFDTGLRAALPEPAAAPLPSVESARAPVEPKPADAAQSTPIPPQLDERLQRIESIILELRSKLDELNAAKLAGAAPVVAPVTAPTTVMPASRPVASPLRRAPSPVRVTKAAPPPPPAPPPTLGAQLLAVDLWNGAPSVIVTSGLPGDPRTRILRPGDVINGVSLKAADPAAGSATFGVNDGRSFTLSVQNGG